jgi:hypothetical protein
MRKLLLTVWLLLPAALIAWHFGPGQDFVKKDDAAAAMERAFEAAARAREVAASEGDLAAKHHWTDADAAFGEAIAALPSDEQATVRRLKLERAKARMFLGQLPEVRKDLDTLVEYLAKDPETDPKLLAEGRAALANARYYMTWLMRLEGSPREEWEPEIEGARQTYRLLAEQAGKTGDAAGAERARKDLESAVRLERMEIGDLQGLPLPSQ